MESSPHHHHCRLRLVFGKFQPLQYKLKLLEVAFVKIVDDVITPNNRFQQIHRDGAGDDFWVDYFLVWELCFLTFRRLVFCGRHNYFCEQRL